MSEPERRPTAHAAMTLLRYMPSAVISAPERVFLKFAFAMIGLGLLVSAHTHDGTLAAFPRWAVYELGITFMTGGTASLIGIFRRKRALERFGVACSALACGSYGFAIIAIFGVSRFAGVIIFAGAALACITRLAVSTAAVQVIVAARAYSDVDDEIDDLS